MWISPYRWGGDQGGIGLIFQGGGGVRCEGFVKGYCA